MDSSPANRLNVSWSPQINTMELDGMSYTEHVAIEGMELLGEAT